MIEYWEENLHVLDRPGLIKKLDRISEVFNSLPLPKVYKADQLYFMVENGCEAIHIGLSKRPVEQLVRLRNDGYKSLMLLYFYDPMAEQKRFEETLPDVKIYQAFQTPLDAKNHQINWLNSNPDPGQVQDRIYPDERALQILIKKGMIYLKELMTGLGLDYSKA